MEGIKAPVQRANLNRRELKQKDLSKGGMEWLVQSVSFSVFPTFMRVERQLPFAPKACLFSSALPLITSLWTWLLCPVSGVVIFVVVTAG